MPIEIKFGAKPKEAEEMGQGGMSGEEHNAHMAKIEAGLDQIIEAAQSGNMEEVVSIANSLKREEQGEKEAEAPAETGGENAFKSDIKKVMGMK